MRTRLTLTPGLPGTKALVAEYGDQLICVRYRYDAERRKRYKTVELIVEEVPWYPAGAVVMVRLAADEAALRAQVEAAGGRWNPQRALWELEHDAAARLGLQDRVVAEG